MRKSVAYVQAPVGRAEMELAQTACSQGRKSDGGTGKRIKFSKEMFPLPLTFCHSSSIPSLITPATHVVIFFLRPPYPSGDSNLVSYSL